MQRRPRTPIRSQGCGGSELVHDHLAIFFNFTHFHPPAQPKLFHSGSSYRQNAASPAAAAQDSPLAQTWLRKPLSQPAGLVPRSRPGPSPLRGARRHRTRQPRRLAQTGKGPARPPGKTPRRRPSRETPSGKGRGAPAARTTLAGSPRPGARLGGRGNPLRPHSPFPSRRGGP